MGGANADSAPESNFTDSSTHILRHQPSDLLDCVAAAGEGWSSGTWSVQAACIWVLAKPLVPVAHRGVGKCLGSVHTPQPCPDVGWCFVLRRKEFDDEALLRTSLLASSEEPVSHPTKKNFRRHTQLHSSQTVTMHPGTTTHFDETQRSEELHRNTRSPFTPHKVIPCGMFQTSLLSSEDHLHLSLSTRVDPKMS